MNIRLIADLPLEKQQHDSIIGRRLWFEQIGYMQLWRTTRCELF